MGDRLGIQVAVDILPSFLTPDAKMNTSWYPCRNASSCVSTQLSFDTWTFLYDLYLHFIDKLTGCCCIGWLEQYGHLAGWVARAWFLLQLPTPPLAPGIWCPPYVPTTPAMGASSPSLQGSPLPPSFEYMRAEHGGHVGSSQGSWHWGILPLEPTWHIARLHFPYIIS